MDYPIVEGAVAVDNGQENITTACLFQYRERLSNSYYRCDTCKEFKHISEFYQTSARLRSCKICAGKKAQTRNLIYSGKIEKTGCIRADGTCDGQIEAHHYDGYDNVDSVHFLCTKHHNQVHKELRVVKQA